MHHLGATLLGDREALVWGAGPVGKAFVRELRRQGHGVAAFVDLDPRKIGRAIHGVPVVSVEDAPKHADALALGAVAGVKARTQIRVLAAEQGRREGADFIGVA